MLIHTDLRPQKKIHLQSESIISLLTSLKVWDKLLRKRVPIYLQEKFFFLA